MMKQILIIILSIVVAASCASSSHPEPSAIVSLTSSPTTTATLVSSPTVITLQTPSISGEEPQLVFFISEQGQFQAWIPVAGNIVEYTIVRELLGNLTECHIFHSRLNSAGVTVEYCDLATDNVSSRSSSGILDEISETMKKEYHLRNVIEQIKVSEGAYPELTISGEEDSGGNIGTFKARAILAESRVYFVHMYVYHIDWCYCRHQMDQVVDSFFVASDMSIPFEPTP